MAIPIVTLPYERTFKPNEDGVHHADDRQIDVNVAAAVKAEIRRPKLSKTPFYRPGTWSILLVEGDDLFQLERGLPGSVTEALSDQAAYDEAANMPVAQWISCLRNALAHGGIAYLDGVGASTYGQPVQMYVFVSANYDRCGDQREVTRLNVLRIKQDDFVQFLRNWMSWLQDAGIELEPAA